MDPLTQIVDLLTQLVALITSLVAQVTNISTFVQSQSQSTLKKREFLASQIFPAMTSNQQLTPDQMIELSIQQADALLARLIATDPGGP